MAESTEWGHGMRVGVIGLGTVGQAVCELFAGRAESVIGWDVAGGGEYPTRELAGCDFAVVCVDTPFDGRAADTAKVEAALACLPCDRVLLKSTVPPGTTERLAREHGKQICYWPEYISESTYHNPCFPSSILEVPFVVLGGPPPVRSWFIDRLLPVLGPTKTYFQCTSTEAELVKYAENAYFATKITFVNEFRRLSEAFGADWHSVREGWLLDPRVGRMHTAAFADAPGFAGKCLPKDLASVLAAARAVDHRCGLLEAVQEVNEEFRRRDG